jgi:hypothetical protein
MDKNLRTIILKLQNRLGDDDRLRLHFFLGDVVPRTIRDDSSLRGTFKLMDSLFDQDKINERDFTLLIHAFDEIQCIDAAKLLRGNLMFQNHLTMQFQRCLEHLTRIQSDECYSSLQSLTSIMPPLLNDLLQDQEEEEDKYMSKYCKRQIDKFKSHNFI